MRKLFFIAMAASLAAFVAVSCTKSKKSEQSLAERDSTFTNLKHPEWSRNAVIYEVNLRQYTEGGTVKEFEGQLQRLKEL